MKGKKMIPVSPDDDSQHGPSRGNESGKSAALSEMLRAARESGADVWAVDGKGASDVMSDFPVRHQFPSAEALTTYLQDPDGYFAPRMLDELPEVLISFGSGSGKSSLSEVLLAQSAASRAAGATSPAKERTSGSNGRLDRITVGGWSVPLSTRQEEVRPPRKLSTTGVTPNQLIGKQLHDSAGHTLNVTAVVRDGDRWEIIGIADCPTGCFGRHSSREKISAWATDLDLETGDIFGWEID